MSKPLLTVERLAKRFGGIVASDDLALDVADGELHAVIGPNGAGKTTLIGQLSGQVPPDSGRIRFAGNDITALPMYRRSQIGLARSFQITSLFLDLSVLDEPMAGLGPEESARMVEMLRVLKRELSILLVEHDMEAVFALADRITVLVYGRVIASGAPADIRANAEVRQAYLGEAEAVHG